MFQILLSMFNNHHHHLRNKVFQVVEKIISLQNLPKAVDILDILKQVLKILDILMSWRYVQLCFSRVKKVEIPLNSKWTSFCGNLKLCMAVMQSTDFRFSAAPLIPHAVCWQLACGCVWPPQISVTTTTSKMIFHTQGFSKKKEAVSAASSLAERVEWRTLILPLTF